MSRKLTFASSLIILGGLLGLPLNAAEPSWCEPKVFLEKQIYPAPEK